MTMKVLTKEDIVEKIKAAESKYYKESPCLHCGPGNGCDDCRGCEDAKKDFELSKIRRAAYNEYEQRFGVSYQQDSDYDRIVKKEEEYNEWVNHCKKCGGNFDDDCQDCEDWENKLKTYNSLKWLKEDFKRKYNIDYDKYKNNIHMKHTNLIEFINENIENHGAKEFFNIVQNNFFSISEDIKQCILNEVEKQIKPDKIKTIEDLAKLLDGNEYGYELKNKNNINVEELCKQNNWVVVFPYSDDNVELCGAIDDEIGAWNGTILKYVVKGEFYLEDCDEYGSSDPDIYYKKAQENMFVNISESELKDIKKNCLNWKEYNGVIIEALWSPKDIDASWQINAVGCANSVKFNIMEDGELYAECVVIDLNNIN